MTDTKLSPEQESLALKTLLALSKSLDPTKGNGPGYVLQEIGKDRVGIMYYREQTKEFQQLKKVLIHFADVEKPVLKSIEKLIQIGFVD